MKASWLFGLVAVSCAICSIQAARSIRSFPSLTNDSSGCIDSFPLSGTAARPGNGDWPYIALPDVVGSPRYDILQNVDHYLKQSGLTSFLHATEHKRLWPLSASDIIGFVLTILVLFIAAGGGIGGGGAIIPLYLLFLGFDTKVAVALGNITIVGGSLSNFVFNAPRRHAIFNRPLIDWDLILVMEPSTILGALIGGYINKVLPAWLTTVLLGALLTFITYKLVVRGVITWRNETEHKHEEDEQRQPLLENDHSSTSGIATEGSTTGTPQAIQTARDNRRSMHHASYSPIAYSNSLARSSAGPISRADLRQPFRQAAILEPEEEETRSEPETDLASSLEGLKDNESGSQLRETASEPILDDQLGTSSRGYLQGDQDRLGNIDEENTNLQGGNDGRSTGERRGAKAKPAADEAPPRRGDNDDTEGDEWQGNDAELDAKQKDLDEKFAEKRQLPPVRLGVMILLTAVVAVSDYFKGRVNCGGWLYWVLVLIIIPVVGIVTFAARAYLLKKRRAKAEAGYVWREGDVDWNPVTTLVYPAICSIAGLVAGMFGVGGGIIKGPLMLELGVLPDVASATSATMIVFTSASASIVFLSFGGIPKNYAIAVFIIGIIFTMAGQVACYILMRALGRRSIIVFAMAALMVLSMIITYYEAIIGIIAAVHEHSVWKFGRVCR